MAALAPTPLPPWTDTFLTELAAHGMEQTASKVAGTTVRAVRKLCEDNSEFAYAVEAALEASADVAETELRRRAIEGVPKGIYYQGELVDVEHQYSDSLLLALVKAKRRREFGDKTEVSGPGGAPLVVNIRTFGPPPLQEGDPDSAVVTGQETIDVTFRQLSAPHAQSAGEVYSPVDAHDLV